MARTKKTTSKYPAHGTPIAPGATIENCSFYGVKWDGPAIASVQTIATALQENAKALGVLANIFRAANVTIETMLKVESPVNLTGVSMMGVRKDE